MPSPGAGLAIVGALVLLMGSGVAVFRVPVSRRHRRWMEMFLRRLGAMGIRPRQPIEDATSPGAWLTVGVLSALLGAAFLVAGLNLLFRP